jgi:hypothetical protein
MPFLLMLAIQIALVVHVIRTNQPKFWIFVILLLPPLGPLIYGGLVLIPEWRRSWQGRRLARKAQELLTPGRQRDALGRELAVADTVENRLRYAEEALRLKDYASARQQFEAAATGLYATEPRALLGLARAAFGLDDFLACKRTLDRLIEAHPSFRDPDAHLLYARTLEGLGDLNQALGEYEALSGSFPGEEARVRHADLLLRLGRVPAAREVLRQVADRAAAAPSWYRDKESAWIREAANRVKSL